MKITTNYNTVNVETTITLDQYKRVKKFAPNALVLVDAKEQPVFAVAHGNIASINNAGIVFNNTTAEGNMFLSLDSDKLAQMDAEKKKAYVKETYGVALISLKQIEDNINTALENVDTRLNTLDEAITCN